MRTRHLTLFVLLLGIFAAVSEIKPTLEQLQPGAKIYLVAKNDSEEKNRGTLAVSQFPLK